MSAVVIHEAPKGSLPQAETPSKKRPVQLEARYDSVLVRVEETLHSLKSLNREVRGVRADMEFLNDCRWSLEKRRLSDGERTKKSASVKEGLLVIQGAPDALSASRKLSAELLAVHELVMSKLTGKNKNEQGEALLLRQRELQSLEKIIIKHVAMAAGELMVVRNALRLPD